MIKLVERITRKVTAAISLIDNLSSDKNVIDDIFIRIHGFGKNSIFYSYSTGYYFFLDTPNRFKITIESSLYKKEDFEINIVSLKDKLSSGGKSASPKILVAKIKLTRK